MIINIDKIEDLPNKTLLIDFNQVISDLETTKPVTGNLKITATGFGVNIKGLLSTEIDLECDRCLKKYTEKIEFEVDEDFVKEPVFDENQTECMLTSENFVEELNNKKEIDLTDFVYQSVILNLPNKKLCSINCPGSDEYFTSQKEEEIDPRLEIFKEITNKIKKK